MNFYGKSLEKIKEFVKNNGTLTESEWNAYKTRKRIVWKYNCNVDLLPNVRLEYISKQDKTRNSIKN